MVPKIAAAGSSFKGAALYYLHDKKALSSDRVAFTETVNLPTNDPDRAVTHMIDTATHANELKQAAGLKGGRRLEKPVYCYSLAWHPSEAPTRAEQIEAARATLRELGIADRQALIVSHNDTDHPHVHVIVNRVCPETGRAANMGNDRLKLSTWAQTYEQERGQIHCPEREKNNAKRAFEYTKSGCMTRQEWEAWRKGQSRELWNRFRDDKAAAIKQRGTQYQALWDQKEARFALRRDEIKALYKPIWRDVFKRQEKALADFDAGVVSRIKFALSQPKSRLLGVVQAVLDTQPLRKDFVASQEAERAKIGVEQKARITDAGKELNKAYRHDLGQLKAMHKAEDDRRYSDTKAQSKAIWDTAEKDFDQAQDRRKDTGKRKTFSEKAAEKLGSEQREKSERQARKAERSRKRGRGRSMKR